MVKDHVFQGKINIQADRKTHFKIIKRVMYSCAMAGYGNINFAILWVQAGSGGLAVLEACQHRRQAPTSVAAAGARPERSGSASPPCRRYRERRGVSLPDSDCPHMKAA